MNYNIKPLSRLPDLQLLITFTVQIGRIQTGCLSAGITFFGAFPAFELNELMESTPTHRASNRGLNRPITQDRMFVDRKIMTILIYYDRAALQNFTLTNIISPGKR